MPEVSLGFNTAAATFAGVRTFTVTFAGVKVFAAAFRCLSSPSELSEGDSGKVQSCRPDVQEIVRYVEEILNRILQDLAQEVKNESSSIQELSAEFISHIQDITSKEQDESISHEQDITSKERDDAIDLVQDLPEDLQG